MAAVATALTVPTGLVLADNCGLHVPDLASKLASIAWVVVLLATRCMPCDTDGLGEVPREAGGSEAVDEVWAGGSEALEGGPVGSEALDDTPAFGSEAQDSCFGRPARSSPPSELVVVLRVLGWTFSTQGSPSPLMGSAESWGLRMSKADMDEVAVLARSKPRVKNRPPVVSTAEMSSMTGGGTALDC